VKKKDLKVGYVVVVPKIGLMMVMNSNSYSPVIVGKDVWMELDDYDENLNCTFDSEYGINAVYGYSDYVMGCLKLDVENRPRLWVRTAEGGKDLV
jgi:hypothetical protein